VDVLVGRASAFVLTLLAALAAVNRMDSVLLYVPALIEVFWRERSWRSAWRMALGWSPLLMWLAFSLFYYGFPFPNTAYAKLNDAIPLGPRLAQGFYYLWNSLRWDPLTLATIGVAIIMGCWLLRVRRSASASIPILPRR